ncbi:Vacuolar protein sorting-associated protein, partial [Globisporangium splendens]
MATPAPSSSSSPSHSTLFALDNGALPLRKLRGQYERALLEVLGDVNADEVTVVFSSRIATLLTHVLVNGLDVLKQHRDGGFTECVEITDEIAKVHCHTVVYLSSPSVDEIRGVAMHAGMLQSQHDGKDLRALFLYVTGKWTSLCDDVLAQYHLQDDFQTIGCFSMGFVPLDTDLLTLGRERCLYECAIAGNKSALLDVALALNQLQDLYGKFDHIKYKGELAMLVLNHMMELSQGAGHTDTDPDLSQSSTHKRHHRRHRNPMNTLVILDRRVDYASALCTPLTYEAPVDEILHIYDGFISLSPMLLTSDPNASDVQMPFALNSNDAVF